MIFAAALALGAYCALYYLSAGLAINLAYHRALSHRSLVLAKPIERLFVTLGLPAGTPVQWAGNHRQHHARADRPGDPHSPLDGFWHAHNGWYLGVRHPLPCILYALAGPLRVLLDGWHRPRSNQQHNHLAPDVAADRYYAWVSRPGPFLMFAVAHVLVFFGGAAWVWGGPGVAALWATLALVTNLGDAIDSVAHLAGERPYAQPSRARNVRVLGWLALGEGWHANHHRFPWSARHGVLPGQHDWTDGVLRGLERLGFARDVRRVSADEVARALGEEHAKLVETAD